MTRSLWKSVGTTGGANQEWVGSDPSKHFEVYTRGNAGEVYPEVFTPLSFSMASEAGEEAMRNAVLSTGLIRKKEFDGVPISTAIGSGVFGGYAYLNLSLQRLAAARAPGGKASDADVNFLGVGTPPPHRQMKGERDILASLAGLRYVIRLLRNPDRFDLASDQRKVDDFLASLPDRTTASDTELDEAIRSLMPLFAQLFGTHLEVTMASSVMLGVLSNLCEKQLDDPDLAVRLLAGLGDVDSAAPSVALWDLGRLVNAEPAVSALFDGAQSRAQMIGLLGQLQEEPQASTFVSALRRFLDEFGSRGPNEWDTAFDTWETDPALALTLVDRMRLADESHNPKTQATRLSADQLELEAETLRRLKGPVRGIFKRVLAGARKFSQGRERAKTTVILAIHGARLMAMELDRRLAERSGGQKGDLWFLVEEEVPAYIDDPAGSRELIRKRRALHEELSARVPPFFFAGQMPPLQDWELRNAPRTQVGVGEVLKGIPGCLGVARGRARVVTDPADPGDLQPGDVLVAPITDPSWTPLFVPAEGVVVDVGAVMSHAVIVSRELGIPCVVSATDATRRIPDGALVEVDGDTGTVTVLELP